MKTKKINMEHKQIKYREGTLIKKLNTQNNTPNTKKKKKLTRKLIVVTMAGTGGIAF